MKKNVSPINLTEAISIIGSENWINDSRLLDFMKEIENVATEILKDKDDEYLNGAVALVQSSVLMSLYNEEMISLIDLFHLAMDDKFMFIIAFAFKSSIGLAAIEELR